MNDFHLFSIHIKNKDTNRAMLILRDKPESVARRIMIKARVNVPSCTGKSFWSWAQKYIIDTCRVDRGNNNVQPLRYTVQNTPVKPNRPESSSARYDKGMRFSGNVARPLQHVVSDSSAPRDIRNRPDGVSTVLPGLGHKCVEKTGETPAERQQAMDMGRNNSANILSGVSQTRSLVCTEYPVRVRGRHTTAGVDSAVRKKGRGLRRNTFSGYPAFTHSGKLWASGAGSGHSPGRLAVTGSTPYVRYSRNSHRDCVTVTKWHHSHHYAAGQYSPFCSITNLASSTGCHLIRPKFNAKKQLTVYAPAILLSVIRWPSVVLCSVSGRHLRNVSDPPSM